MKCRVGFLILAATLLSVAFPHGQSSTAWAQQPNIVVIMTDDQPDLDVLKTMPTLRQEMAWKGVTFRNSFVDFSLCCPSRASFLTGLAAHNHHVTTNSAVFGGGYAKFFSQGWENETIGVWLKQAGYRTAMIGKYLNQYPSAAGLPQTHRPPGWDEWQVFVRGDAYFNYDLNNNGEMVRYGSKASDYSTDVFTAKAVDFIRRQRLSNAPFFLLLMPIAPHVGRAEINDDGMQIAIPAPRHRGRFSSLPLPGWPSFNEADVSDKPGHVQSVPLMDASNIDDLTTVYRRMNETLLAVDDMVRKVFRALEKIGKLDNTIVIYTSDNGMQHGQHRLTGKQAPYEESIRVPLIVRGPGVPKGQVRRQIVNNLDVVATIVSAAGATPGHVIDGRDLMPLIKNPNTAWRTALLVHGNDPDFDAGNQATYTEYFAVRTHRHIYIAHETLRWGTEHELYDLVLDPYQLTNLAGDAGYQGLLAGLQSILMTLKTCSGETCWFVDRIRRRSSAAKAIESPVSREPAQNIYGTRRNYDVRQLMIQ